MQEKYNLIEKPWIPCKLINNELRYLGLKNVFLMACEIKEIQAELPPMTASILFVLLAILYRTQKIDTDFDWEEIWESKSFNIEKLEQYLKDWHDRFDLFDAEHPFFQDPKVGKREKDLKNLKGGEVQIKPITSLILHSSSGDAATLFDHTLEDEGKIFNLDEISRLLLMFQSFSLGGMTSASVSIDKYYKDSPHARGVTFFIRGNNLFQTLMLNLIAKNEWTIKPTNQDIPAWEKGDPFENDRTKPEGMIDFLTWQSRRIQLIPEELKGRTIVRHLLVNPGLGISDELINPFFSVQLNEAKTGKIEKKILRFSESKALWRDSTVLIEPSSKIRKPPEALTWVNSLRAENIVEGEVNLLAFGLCTDPGKKKAFFYRTETFDFPIIYLKNEELRNYLNRGLDLSKEVHAQLWGALKQMAGLIVAFTADKSDGRKASPVDEQNLMNHWGTEDYYWNNLEVPFYRFLHSLPESADEAFDDWKKDLQKTAVRSFDYAVMHAGNSVSVMKASAKGKRQLLGGIHKILYPSRKEG